MQPLDGSDPQGFELVAASIRADSADLPAFLEVLAVKLADALPGMVVVKRGGGVFSRNRPVSQIDVALDDHRYTAAVRGPSARHLGRARGPRRAAVRRAGAARTPGSPSWAAVSTPSPGAAPSLPRRCGGCWADDASPGHRNDAVGHVLPLLPVVRALDAAGHQVNIASPGAQVGRLARIAGVTAAVPAGPVDDLDDPPPKDRHEARLRWAVQRSWPSTARGWTAPLLDCARAWRPDVVLSEPVEHAGRLVAATLDLPLGRARLGLYATY